jgi:hypothetical protein
VGVRKRIGGASGETALGPLPGVPFDVVGLSLRYRAPFRGFVDELEPIAAAFAAAPPTAAESSGGSSSSALSETAAPAKPARPLWSASQASD